METVTVLVTQLLVIQMMEMVIVYVKMGLQEMQLKDVHQSQKNQQRLKLLQHHLHPLHLM